MAGRRLDPDERALWARVAATVTPLPGRADLSPAVPADPASRRSDERREAGQRRAGRTAPSDPDPGPRPDDRRRTKGATAADTLDGGWDRRLRRGAVTPDRSIDLHGHTLASAHAALDAALAQAVADDRRVLLVVTGKPPRASEQRRGLIRASIGDWLASSRHAYAIAAVRNAHPRHGGAGALYLILRRRRGG